MGAVVVFMWDCLWDFGGFFFTHDPPSDSFIPATLNNNLFIFLQFYMQWWKKYGKFLLKTTLLKRKHMIINNY